MQRYVNHRLRNDRTTGIFIVAILVFSLLTTTPTGASPDSEIDSSGNSSMPASTSAQISYNNSNGSPDVTSGGGAGPVKWGWDSFGGSTALAQGTSYLSTIAAYYGKHNPSYVGLYLDHNDAPLLTNSVAKELHGNGIGIFLISDLADSSNGMSGTKTQTPQQQAESDASFAVNYAVNTLNVPANNTVAIYADVEENTSISSKYIVAWYQTLESDGFIPGFYANPEYGQFNSAFCSSGSTVTSGSALWMDEPNGAEANQYYPSAPWSPLVPTCLSGSTATITGWQFLNGLTVQGVPPTTMTIDMDSFSQVGAW